jgi:hypothetical protein
MSALRTDQAGMILPGENIEPDNWLQPMHPVDTIVPSWMQPANPTTNPVKPVRKFKPFNEGGPFQPRWHSPNEDDPGDWPGQRKPRPFRPTWDYPVPGMPGDDRYRDRASSATGVAGSRRGLPGISIGARTTPTGRRPQ